MNRSVQLLYNEHEIIVSAIEMIKNAEKILVANTEKYEILVRELIFFFRNYADKFHHFKEEEILFPEMNKKNELIETGVIKEMLDNHEEFRIMLGNIELQLDSKNYNNAHQQLKEYAEAILDHIAVENEEVFQMAETLFSEDELEKINFRFADCDRELGDNKKRELEKMIINFQIE